MKLLGVAVVLGALGGLGCRLASAVIPQPWPSLFTTSATWGLLVFGLLLAARQIVSRVTAGEGPEGAPAPPRLWTLAGACSMTAVLLCSGAWLSVLTVVAAVLAGALVGLVSERIHRGDRAWIGVIGGLLMGEGVYGSWFGLGVQYRVEFVIGLLVCQLAGHRWLRSVLFGLTVAAVVGFACLIYDSVRPFIG